MKANESQVGGGHYKAKAIQPWDYITSNNLGYLEGNIVKYVSRWKDKGGIQDLEKARHYLYKLIEIQSAEPETGADKTDEGWIEWKGGECPVPIGTFMDIRLRDGSVFQRQVVTNELRWSSIESSADIVAYKVVE